MPSASPSSTANAALVGISGWVAYGVTECVSSPILLWAGNSVSYLEPGWSLVALSFVLYAIAGVITGTLAGRLLRTIPAIRAGVSATIAGTFTLAYAAWSERTLTGMIPAGIAAGFLMLCIASVLGWVKGNLAGPWTTSLATVGCAYFIHTADGLAGAGMAALWVAAVCACSWWWNEIRTQNNPWRSLLGTSSLAVLALGVSLFTTQAPVTGEQPSAPATSSPNIILIVMDTVRADHTSAYGYDRDTTPNLERLARESILYTRAISTSDMTLGSHASLFTGIYPRRLGTYYHNGRFKGLDDSVDTLAEKLAAAHYATLAVVSNHGFLGQMFGFQQGFAWYDIRTPAGLFTRNHDIGIRGAIRRVAKRFVPLYMTEVVFRDAATINSAVFHALESTNAANRPFFLFVNYMDAHDPYLVTPPFHTRYPGRNPHFGTLQLRNLVEQVVAGQRSPTAAEREHILSQYDGGIAFVDHAIGELIERLKRMGVYDNTLLIVTSDHGEALGRHSLLGHGNGVSQRLVHVPLLVKLPGNAAARTDDSLVTGADLLPTVLDVLKIRIPLELDGRSLLKTSTEPRLIIAESYPSPRFDHLTDRFHRVETAVFAGAHKLIYSSKGHSQLFYLPSDPGELRDLYSQSTAAELEAAAREWQGTAARNIQPKSLEKSTLDRLKSLGYVQ